MVSSLTKNAVVPLGMFSLGAATGFVLRDEMTMPTYMRIKMALVENNILTRRKLNADVVQMLDPNLGKLRYQRQHEKTLREHEEQI